MLEPVVYGGPGSRHWFALDDETIARLMKVRATCHAKHTRLVDEVGEIASERPECSNGDESV